MATLSIRRLANRVVAPDAATAWAAAPVLDSAARRLPAMLDPLLTRAAAIAGLSPDAAVAVGRLAVRLPFQDEPDRLAADWAAAITATLAEAFREAAGAQPVPMEGNGLVLPPGDETDDTSETAVFADVWGAETAILRRIAAGLPLPWWADSLVPGSPDAARIVGEWIERDPARAAVYLLDLLRDGTFPAVLPGQAAARRLAGRLLQRVSIASPARSASSAAGTEGDGWDPETRGWAEIQERLPAWLRASLHTLPAEGRALFSVAALMVHAPATTPWLGRSGRSPEQLGTALATPSGPLAIETGPAASSAAQAEPTQLPGLSAGLSVMNGGLLMLLRPLLDQGIVTAIPPGELPALLLGIGLVALQRISAPLSPAARRVLLERDRSLLAAFAGTDPPDAPLDAVAAPPRAASHLDEAVARAPPGIGWAPGALRRYYGGPDPFGDAPEGQLARLVLRPGRLGLTRWSADLTWPLTTADIALRRAGWDIDLGWLPWIGRVVRFHYDGADAT